jgi:hypothetical protein
MKFKDWLLKEEGFISKGKADKSRFKPGPHDTKRKPHDLKLCGIGGGPGPGGACASSGAGPIQPNI